MSPRAAGLRMAVVFCALAAPAAAQVQVTTLDTTGNVGAGSALAYGPTGLALVSYADQTNSRIKVAECQNAACTQAALHVVDADPTVSGPTSLAFGPDGRAYVAYRGAGTVRIAHCVDAACTGATVQAIAAPGLQSGPALGVGGDGLPIVAFGASVANVAHCDDAECATSTVTPHPTVPGANVGLTVPADGLALFNGDDNTDLIVGHCSNAACTVATYAGFYGITFPPSQTVRYRKGSLATSSNGLGAMVMEIETGSILGPGTNISVTRCANAACSSFGGTGSLAGATLTRPVLAFRPGDLPLVANYLYAPFPDGQLVVERCDVPACGGFGGVPNFPVDVPGVGNDPAIAVGADGVGLVSYSESANGDLKVAHLQGIAGELSIADATVVEGNGSTTTAAFTVTLSQPVDALVDYATAGATASSGTDFLAASGVLTFSAGSLSQTVTVSIVGDLLPENLEFFSVQLSNPQGATIVDAAAVGYILDDDVGPVTIEGELAHGATLVGDLAALPGPVADDDNFRIRQDAYASYEVVADAVSSDLTPLDLRLWRSDPSVGELDVQTGHPVGTGTSLSMTWQNADFPILNQWVRVRGACGASCGPDDVYRLRMYDTTLRGARFNNAAGQKTFLIVQNLARSQSLTRLTAYFWSPSGVLLSSWNAVPLLVPGQVVVLDTSQLPLLGGATGSVTITHSGPYGTVVGKTVALDPFTGLAFDAPLEPRPR